MDEPRQLTSILGVLLREGVEFVLVGALAAVAQGAPVTTHDVDIVHARTPDNLDRLMAALGKLNARYRGRAPDSPVPPDRKALATAGHSLFIDRPWTARLPRRNRRRPHLRRASSRCPSRPSWMGTCAFSDWRRSSS